MHFICVFFDVIVARRGCYWYADGSMYDGQWALGKMHGKGVFIYPNGNRSVGIFFYHLILS
jgi:hypothetical protein